MGNLIKVLQVVSPAAHHRFLLTFDEDMDEPVIRARCSDVRFVCGSEAPF